MRKRIIRRKIGELVSKWKRRCEIGKDAHVAITGDEGDGKSSLACYWILRKQFKGDLWTNVVYTKNPKEFYDKYEQLETGQCMVIDEAVEIINRVDWAKLELRELTKKFAADVRKEKNAVFIYNIPLFRDLHPYWRNHRIRWWIELMPREWFKKGVSGGMVLKRERIPFITGKRDTWLLDEEEKLWLKKMHSRGALRGRAYFDMLRKHPFYYGEFKFKIAKESFYKRYEKYRLEAKETYEASLEYEKTPQKVLMWKGRTAKLVYLLNQGMPYKCPSCNNIIKLNFTQNELASMIGTTQQVISLLLKFYRQGVKAGVFEEEKTLKKDKEK